MIEYERLCLELNQFHILSLSMFLFIIRVHKLRLRVNLYLPPLRVTTAVNEW